jgi:hypothetical protein
VEDVALLPKVHGYSILYLQDDRNSRIFHSFPIDIQYVFKKKRNLFEFEVMYIYIYIISNIYLIVHIYLTKIPSSPSTDGDLSRETRPVWTRRGARGRNAAGGGPRVRHHHGAPQALRLVGLGPGEVQRHGVPWKAENAGKSGGKWGENIGENCGKSGEHGDFHGI